MMAVGQRSLPPTLWTEKIAWLQLIRSPGIGPIRFWRLLERFGSVDKALESVSTYLHKRQLQLASLEDIEAEISKTDRQQARYIFYGAPEYPPMLYQIEDAPPVLVQRGQQSGSTTSRAVAIVGARTASLQGQKFAESLSKGLGESGVIVVSGLARGIDAAAHRGALSTGTIAFIAGGIDTVYPIENRELYQQICENGCILTEFAIGTQPQPTHFARRNRLISGCSAAVAIIEAAPKSGSLITAQYALAQGREVFAVPGHPYDIRYRGCNQLLRDGAHWLESPLDILEHLGADRTQPTLTAEQPLAQRPLSDSNLRVTIQTALSTTPTDIDTLVRALPHTASEIFETLSELELLGLINRNGTRVSLMS
jgi:DNA processing protein